MLFRRHLAQTYKKAVAGVLRRRLPLSADGRHLLRLSGDPKISASRSKAEGLDPDWLIDRYAWMMHEAIKDRPADMVIGMHMCRGNFRSTWAAEGGYDAAADAIFNKTGVDIFFMEYDTDRAGGLEPLRLLPKGKKRVMPGFITTKTGELENLDDLQAPVRRGRPSTPTSTSSASRRSAASPRPRTATPSPRTTRSASWSWSSRPREAIWGEP